MLQYNQKEKEREATKMKEIEMFVGMMDRAKIRIKIVEQDKETHVFLLDSDAEYIFGEWGQLVEIL